MADRKITSIEQTESFEGILVNDSGNPRQATNENVRKVLGISGAETAIDKLNTDLASAVSEIQKNTEADAETKRKLDFLWKLNQGISYQYETDSASAYQKDIPSGAKCATVNKVGGKTVVWNQLADVTAKTSGGITISKSSDGTVTVAGTRSSSGWFTICEIPVISGHIYLMRCNNFKINDDSSLDSVKILKNYSAIGSISASSKYVIATADSATTHFRFATASNADEYVNYSFIPQATDLTQMFGSGNEPSTVAEFESMFPADYYPYNAGTLMSAPVNEVVEQGKNLLQYPYLTTTTTKNGITFTDNGDGSISVKGTATSSTFFDLSNIRYHDSDFSLTATRTSYTVNDKTTSATGLVDGVGIVYNKDNKLTSIRVNSGATVDTTVCVQIEKSSSATEYSAPFKNIYPIPESIMQLDGYGWGITDDVCNYVDWENKTYHQRIGSVDLGTLDWTYYDGYQGFYNNSIQKIIKKASSDSIPSNIISVFENVSDNDFNKTIVDKQISSNTYGLIKVRNLSYTDASAFKTAMSGVMLYYELAEEIVTDISDIIGDTFQNPFDVEAGGTLTFKNSNGDDYRIPVPNEEEYLISLVEVTA